MTGLDDRHVLYPQYAIEIGNLPQHADIFCTYWLFIFVLTKARFHLLRKSNFNPLSTVDF